MNKLILAFLALLFSGLSFSQIACGDTIYDSGGAFTNYLDFEDDTILICPSNPGEAIELNFLGFESESNFDFLYIYDSNQAGTNLIGTYTGLQTIGTVVAENTSGCITLVWHTDGSVTRPGYSAVVNCVPMPTCFRPSDLAVSGITSNSAVFNWTSNDTEIRWILEYGAPGFTPGTGTDVVSLTNPRTVTGLSPVTTYDMYIRARCGVGDTSSYFGPITFTTTTAPLFCGDVFTDSGSDTSTYQFNEDFTYVACPTSPGTVVQVTFSEFDIEQGWDFMTVYDANNSFTNQIGQYTGTNSPGIVVAENTSGCLTFHFTSDGVINDTGWVANIACIPTPTCLKPTNIVTSNATDQSISVGWTSANTESQWVIQYGEAGFALGTGTLVTANSNPFTINGLNASTTYDFYVKAVCGSNDSSTYSLVGTGTTLNAPLICGNLFTDSGGPNATYQNNENETYSICPTNPNQVVLLSFTELALEANFDSLLIYNGNSTSGTPIAALSGNTLPGQVYSTDPSGCLTAVFTSDGSVTLNGWNATIQCVDPITCPEPNALTVAINGNTATLSWTSMGSETSWLIEYDTTGFTLGTGTQVIANSNPFTITNLDFSTNYDFYVQAVCSSTDSSIFEGPTTGTTDLAPFECGNLFLDNGGVNNYTNNASDTTVICPSPGFQTVEVVFSSFETEQNFDSLMIYNGNGTSGTLLGTYQGQDTVGTVISTDPSGCLTFVFISDGSVTLAGWEAQINCYGTCPPPSNVVATPISNFDATIAWNSNGSETQWQIEYGPTGFTPGTGTTIQTNSNPHTLSGLAINTTYDVYVKALCSGTDTSIYSSDVTFTTLNNVGIASAKTADIRLYPNPTKDQVTIESSMILGELTITDVQGKKVQTINMNSLEHTFQVNNLEPGMYFIKWNGSNETLPFVKN